MAEVWQLIPSTTMEIIQPIHMVMFSDSGATNRRYFDVILKCTLISTAMYAYSL